MQIGLIIFLGFFGVIVIGIFVWIVMWLIAKSKGKIEIVLDKYNFSPGETIKGKAVVTIKKPLQSKGLLMGIYAERKTTQMNYSAQGNRRSTSYQKIFEFNEPVAKGQDYSPGEYSYDFEIKIPENISPTELGGVVGTLVKTAEMLSGSGLIYWYLKADLDIPGLDITQTVQVNIS